MKKILSGLTALLTASALSLTAAANVKVEPIYPMHGNKCGLVTVAAEIDRDVHVVIVQNTPEGDYTYYDEIISVDADDRTFEFALEGRIDVDYTVTIGVPKYKGSNNYEEYSNMVVFQDTDEIADGSIDSYTFTYNIKPNEEDIFNSEKIKDYFANEDKIVQSETDLYFPALEGLKGDANGDGIINVRDAAAIASALAKGVELPSYADFNGDGKVNIRDAAAIAGSLLKK